MERHTKQSADVPKWSALLVEAVNKPRLRTVNAKTAPKSRQLATGTEGM